MRHIRFHQSLLAAAEKLLLIRIAARLPDWIHCERLTLLALAAMALAGAGFAIAPVDRAGLWLEGGVGENGRGE